LSAWLVEAQGWRGALFTLAAILALLTILPHALVLRRRPEDLGLLPDGIEPKRDVNRHIRRFCD
jgi:sugar phosphate permease